MSAIQLNLLLCTKYMFITSSHMIFFPDTSIVFVHVNIPLEKLQSIYPSQGRCRFFKLSTNTLLTEVFEIQDVAQSGVWVLICSKHVFKIIYVTLFQYIRLYGKLHKSFKSSVIMTTLGQYSHLEHRKSYIYGVARQGKYEKQKLFT